MIRTVLGIVLAVVVHSTLSTSSTARIDLISVDQEIQIGREAQAEVKRQVPELGGDIGAYVSDVGRQLAARATGPRYPYSFSIANYREINAFALPGGPVWVHRGAMQAAENESQLVGVIAHEIAHISQRHAADRLTKALVANGLLTLLGAVVGNDRGGRATQIGAQILAGGYMMKFSRDDEREADRVGLDIMRRAGWDQRGMVEFFQIIRREQGRDPSRVEVFLSSHPSPASRASELAPLVRAGGRRDSERFRDVRRKLDRLPAAPRMPRQ